MELLVVLIVWLVSAALVGWIAMWDGADNPSGPFLLGLMTGPIALVLAIIFVRPWQGRARA